MFGVWISSDAGGQMHKLAMIVCATSVSLTAQWPNYPTAGVPRTPEGKPDLSAPMPRSADGKPDLSGVWLVRNGSFYLTSDLKPEEMRPWAAALYKQRADDFRKESDGIACLPPGPKAGIGVGPYPMKIVQTANLVLILYEYEINFRQIFTDGRALPEDPNPTWMGYSVGRWDGDTLVVTTTGYNDRTSIDLAGHPHTEALRMTERFHRRDSGHLDVQVTLDDPKAYTRPWTLPMEFTLVSDGELIEYVCENERDAPHLVGKSGAEFRVPAEVLARYAGAYQRPTGSTIVSLEGNRLMIGEGQTGKIPLIAHSENSFTMEGTVVEFVQDARGRVTAMIQHWAEGDRNYPRKE
jgi:hypothetical protein